MGRKAARNMYSRNTNKIGIQCNCWFYSQRIRYDARSYDRRINWHYLSSSETARVAIINSLSQLHGAADYDAIVKEINTTTQIPYLY